MLHILCWQRQITNTPWRKIGLPASILKTRCKNISSHLFRPFSLNLASPTKAQINVAWVNMGERGW